MEWMKYLHKPQVLVKQAVACEAGTRSALDGLLAILNGLIMVIREVFV